MSLPPDLALAEVALDVNRQDVVSEVRKPGHRREATDPAVRAMPVGQARDAI